MATALLDEMDKGRKRYVLRKDKAAEEFVKSISETLRKQKRMLLPLIFLDDLDKFSPDSKFAQSGRAYRSTVRYR